MCVCDAAAAVCVCAAAASYKKVRRRCTLQRRIKKLEEDAHLLRGPSYFLQVIHIRGYSDFFNDAPFNVFQVETIRS